MKFLQVSTVQKLVSSMRGLPPHIARTCHSRAGDGQTGRVTGGNSSNGENDDPNDGASSANSGAPSQPPGSVSSVEQAVMKNAPPLNNAEQTTINPADGAAVVTEAHARSDSDVGLLGSKDQGHLITASDARGPPVPPDPETCCGSGCANCVWIKYAEEVKAYYPNEEQKLKEILDMIEDYNVKMFVKMDLGIK